ncbi:MAG: FecR domain-containing protein, partial [Alphaproteobacteria bacterium]|nr:FecR domain-containing protein [Alphaproteobacteria bacterium]
MIGVAFRRLFGGCAVILAASTVNPFPAKAELPAIGVPAAVRPDALGTPPGGEERILQVGLDLIADERIDTGPTGQTHLLFVDGSAISIGPNSSLRLDKFVYDPRAKEGELVVSVSKGLFRFVGGKTSKKNTVLLKAPTAVIGIRGGVAIIQVNTPAQIQQAQNQGQALPPAAATMLFGEKVTMQSGSQTQTMTRPGFTVTQTKDGGVSTPQLTSRAQLTQVLSGLEDPQTPPANDDGSGGGQTPQQLAAIAPAAGGDTPSITNEDVSNDQLSGLNSNQA